MQHKGRTTLDFPLSPRVKAELLKSSKLKWDRTSGRGQISQVLARLRNPADYDKKGRARGCQLPSSPWPKGRVASVSEMSEWLTHERAWPLQT